MAINQNFDGTECDFTSEEFTGFQINIDHPSPVKEIDTPLDTPQTPEHTPNGPDSTEDSFLTAKNESFDLSNLELGKISREMEDFLAEFASGEEKSMVIIIIGIVRKFNVYMKNGSNRLQKNF